MKKPKKVEMKSNWAIKRERERRQSNRWLFGKDYIKWLDGRRAYDKMTYQD